MRKFIENINLRLRLVRYFGNIKGTQCQSHYLKKVTKNVTESTDFVQEWLQKVVVSFLSVEEQKAENALRSRDTNPKLEPNYGK